MKGKLMLYIDQHGCHYYARSVKELREKLGGGHVSKMYVDRKDGTSWHVGYVVGKLWCSAFVPFEQKASWS